MPLNGQVGRRFHLYDSPFGDQSHFYIILTPPNVCQEVVFVNFTKTDPDGEFLIWFEPGEIEFLTDRTTIAYGKGRLRSLNWINEKGKFKEEIIPLSIIHRIVYSAFDSQEMNTDCLQQLANCYQKIYLDHCRENNNEYPSLLD